MPEEVDLRVSAIFGITGFQRMLHLGLGGTIRSVHGGACSVRSKWERVGRAFGMSILYQAIMCPVVRK